MGSRGSLPKGGHYCNTPKVIRSFSHKGVMGAIAHFVSEYVRRLVLTTDL